MPLRTLCGLAVLSLLVAPPSVAPPLAAQPSSATEVWSRFSTPHFELLSNVRPSARAERLVEDLEQLRGALAFLSSEAIVASPLPRKVYFFAANPIYDHYRVRTGAAGSLIAAEHTVYMMLRDQEHGRPERILYRQYLHDVLERNLPQMPLWLLYGIAELYGSFVATAETVEIGIPIGDHLRIVAGSGFEHLPLGELLDVTRRPRGTADLFRIESWCLTHYLLLGTGDGRSKMRRLLEGLKAGRSTRELLHEVYGLSVEDLESRLVEYAKQDTFSNFRLTGAHLPAFSVHSRPLDAAEAYAELGDLLTYSAAERRDEARAHFLAAAELDPDVALAWQGLGFLCLEASQGEECSEYLERAVRLEADDTRSWFLLGRASLRAFRSTPDATERGALLERTVAAFDRAVELEPRFAEAWAQLGSALLIDPATAPESVAPLERAHALLPGRHDVALNLLLAYANVGDGEGADRVVAGLEASDAPPATLERAVELRLQMRYAEANRLLRQDRLEDALGLFARIEAETSDPELLAKASHQADLVTAALEHNRFAERYRSAVDLLRADDREGAAEELEILLHEAREGPQRDAVDLLLEWLLEEKQPAE